jgi:hypothetical protein
MMSDEKKEKDYFEKNKKLRLKFEEGHRLYHGIGCTKNRVKGYKIMRECAIEGNQNAQWDCKWIEDMIERAFMEDSFYRRKYN